MQKGGGGSTLAPDNNNLTIQIISGSDTGYFFPRRQNIISNVGFFTCVSFPNGRSRNKNLATGSAKKSQILIQHKESSVCWSFLTIYFQDFKGFLSLSLIGLYQSLQNIATLGRYYLLPVWYPCPHRQRHHHLACPLCYLKTAGSKIRQIPTWPPPDPSPECSWKVPYCSYDQTSNNWNKYLFFSPAPIKIYPASQLGW